ncbi:NAD(P)-binding protein [Patescibacteria group bacterium]|nr:NAD(P)-binding protein [Patescibacteria group bacterium]
MNSAVVVGGGITGILSAIILKEKLERVYLVEKNPHCGGLLQSFQNEEGVSFDYGAHFLKETGIAELDRILFGEMQEENWHILPFLKAGNFFAGSLNEKNSFVDVTRLTPALYSEGIAKLMDLEEPIEDSSHLEEYLKSYFGEVFTNEVFAPIPQKLYGCELKELNPTAHRLFGLTRIMAFNAFTTREMKKSPFFDQKLAFHSYREGISYLKNYYPKQGGIGQWVSLLQKQMIRQGVEILTSELVQKIEHDENHVSNVILGSERVLPCNLLVWTIPSYLCAKAANLSFSAAPPQLRTSSLYHFVFDSPFQTDLHYVTCYDPSFVSFRITLYSNVRERGEQPPYNCTVEVLSDRIENLGDMQETVVQELVRMGIVPATAQTLYSSSEVVREGFPVLTNTFVSQSQTQLTSIKNSLKNALFLGRTGGGAFFMDEVLRETYQEIINLDSHSA